MNIKSSDKAATCPHQHSTANTNTNTEYKYKERDTNTNHNHQKKMKPAEFLIRQKQSNNSLQGTYTCAVHVHLIYTTAIHGSGALWWWCIIGPGVKKPFQLKAPSLFLDKDKVSQG